MRMTRKIILILLSGVLCETGFARPLLCTPAESVIFSCSTIRSKAIALCGNERGRLTTYRYGKRRRIEMEYSAQRDDKNGFFYNHYFRQHVDYLRIAFVNSEYKYSIFRSYDGNESIFPKYGVAISERGGGELQILCNSTVTDNMDKAIENFRCDESDALGC